ncbi:MAG: ATP-dependent 6-phosphofructokinase [Deltaproteobacteria bacterium]|nr:ATP-dependent 6-phosphofructokinase [Deltaproteobacteria bacterium]
MKKFGILTSGGDCPGLNAVIRAVTMRAAYHDAEVMGIRGGWRGMVYPDTVKLTRSGVDGILKEGGTILGISRFSPYHVQDGVARLVANVREFNLHGLIAVGGEGTLSLALRLHTEVGLRVVGVPKTIDNDVNATEETFGFDTAVAIATEAIDRLRTTAEAHQRVIVVEVMGRDAGWIAAAAGLAGGAELILVPERPALLKDVLEMVKRWQRMGRTSSLIVVAEGALIKQHAQGSAELVLSNKTTDHMGRPRLGGVGAFLAQEIEAQTGVETRVTVLGHTQRGGTPTARDRILATRMGAFAADLCGGSRWGTMAALKCGQMVEVTLQDAVGKKKLLSEDLYEVASTFFD